MKKPISSQSGPSRRIMLGAAFLAPGAALLTGTAMNAARPPMASASGPASGDLPVIITQLPDRAVPGDVLRRAEWLRQRSSVPNPLYYPPRVEQPEPTGTPRQTSREDQPRLAPPAPFLVTALLRGRDGSARAVIDGDLFDVGDELAPGWVISAIALNERRVVVTTPDGDTIRLVLQNSSGDNR